MWLNTDDGSLYDTLEEAQDDFYNTIGLEDIINWILQQNEDYIFNLLFNIFSCLHSKYPSDELIEILAQTENTMFFDYFKKIDEE